MVSVPAPRLQPSCLNSTDAVQSHRQWSAEDLSTIHVGFCDTRKYPSLPHSTIRSIKSNGGGGVRFHLVVKYHFQDSPSLKDMGVNLTVHQLILPPHIKCVFDGLQRLASGLGREQVIGLR